VVTPTADGFDFAANANWAGYDEQLRAVVLKKEELAGRIERRSRRSEGMCPRESSFGSDVSKPASFLTPVGVAGLSFVAGGLTCAVRS